MKHLPHLPTLLLPVLLLSVSVSTHGRRIVSRPMSTASAYATADSASADTLPLTEADLEAQLQHFAAEAHRLDSLRCVMAADVSRMKQQRDALNTQANQASADTAWLRWLQPAVVDSLLRQPFQSMSVEALEQARTLAAGTGDSLLLHRLHAIEFMLEAQPLCHDMRQAINDAGISRKVCQVRLEKATLLARKINGNVTLTEAQRQTLHDLWDELNAVIPKRH